MATIAPQVFQYAGGRGHREARLDDFTGAPMRGLDVRETECAPAKHPLDSILDIVNNVLLGAPRRVSETSTFGPLQIATVVTIASAVLAFGSMFAPSARAQILAGSARPMITRPVVEANLLRLFGNTRPEVNAASDRGRV